MTALTCALGIHGPRRLRVGACSKHVSKRAADRKSPVDGRGVFMVVLPR